jgi:hypothetical protein
LDTVRTSSDAAIEPAASAMIKAIVKMAILSV